MSKRKDDAVRKSAEAQLDLAQDLGDVVGRYDPARQAAEAYAARRERRGRDRDGSAGGLMANDQCENEARTFTIYTVDWRR